MSEITLQKVSKSYESGAEIFKDLSLEIEKNEFFVLVGPSGSGKSTLLRVIAGLEAASSGKILIQDEDVTEKMPQKRKFSMVFQNYALFPHMTVRENILFGLSDKKISKEIQEKRLNQAVEMTDLQKYIDRKPSKLSGGQRQRVALARSIASHQPIMLMDEPLSNLDAKLRESMRTQIKQLQRELNLSIVYVTHDQTEAMTMGDRIAVLNDGKIQQIGRPLELYNSPVNVFVASFIGTPKMNLFTLTKNNQYYQNPDQTVTFAVSPNCKDHRQLIFGIRPEHLSLTSDTTNLNISGQVLNVEHLGSETLVTVNVENQHVRVKLTGQIELAIDSQISLTADPRHTYIFDADTEERLAD